MMGMDFRPLQLSFSDMGRFRGPLAGCLVVMAVFDVVYFLFFGSFQQGLFLRLMDGSQLLADRLPSVSESLVLVFSFLGYAAFSVAVIYWWLIAVRDELHEVIFPVFGVTFSFTGLFGVVRVFFIITFVGFLSLFTIFLLSFFGFWLMSLLLLGLMFVMVGRLVPALVLPVIDDGLGSFDSVMLSIKLTGAFRVSGLLVFVFIASNFIILLFASVIGILVDILFSTEVISGVAFNLFTSLISTFSMLYFMGAIYHVMRRQRATEGG